MGPSEATVQLSSSELARLAGLYLKMYLFQVMTDQTKTWLPSKQPPQATGRTASSPTSGISRLSLSPA